MVIQYVEVAFLLASALVSDIKTYKIKNSIVFPFAAIGIVTNYMMGGVIGLTSAFCGMLIPIFLLFILYALKMLGAGDIKLFCAIGAIMGFEFSLYLIAYSFISGGIIGVILILKRKNGVQRLWHLYHYLKCCFVLMTILPYTDFEDKSDGAKFRFAYAILAGSLIQTVYQII